MRCTREQFEICKALNFIFCKITDNFYLVRFYGNKELHPIGYHIILPLFIKNT